MVPIWEPGLGPSGPARANLLREIRARIAGTAGLADGLFAPWTGVRHRGRDLFLIARDRVLPVDITWGSVINEERRLQLARRLLRTAAAFERRGIMLGPLRPETLACAEDRFRLSDPLIFDLLHPYQRAWTVYSRLHFLPPETLMEGRRGTSADRFALGVTLYWLFTGCLPFADEDERYITPRILAQEPVDPRYYQPRLPASAADATLSLLRKDAGRRPSPATLGPLLSPVTAAPHEQRRWCAARRRIPVPRRPRPARAPLPLRVGGILCLVALGLFVTWRQTRRPPPAPSPDQVAGTVTRLYEALNSGDYPAIAAILAPGTHPPWPRVNCASWVTIVGCVVRAGERSLTARAEVTLEEISLGGGVVRRWAGVERLELSAEGGRWRVTKISRVARVNPSGQRAE